MTEGFTKIDYMTVGAWQCNHCMAITHEPEHHKTWCAGQIAADRNRLAEEVERLRKLCADRPKCLAREFAAWVDRIDAAGRGEGE